MNAAVIQLPYAPRKHQAQLHSELARFSVLNCHRRFGKTVFAINELVRNITSCRLPKPRGAYICPFRSQAKVVAWEYLKDFTRMIPGMSFNESELRADFPNGARITLFGGDNPNSLRGQYFDSVVMDEVAQMAPSLWTQVIRPTLADRIGSCLFIGTPFGYKNEFYRLYELAESQEGWYRRTLTVEDTGVVDPKELEAARAEMSEEEYQQEFMCSFAVAVRGAYYAQEMVKAENEGRITTVPYDEAYPVITSWDLGVSDATVIWYWQIVGAQIRAIRAESFQGFKLSEIIKHVEAHGYSYGQHIAPFDINVRELGEGSRYKQAKRLGVQFSVAPGPKDCSRQSGINAVRTMLPRVVFDRKNCQDGIEALRSYRTEFIEKDNVFKIAPKHDWASDWTDSVRYFAITKHRSHLPGIQQKLDYRNQDMGRF